MLRLKSCFWRRTHENKKYNKKMQPEWDEELNISFYKTDSVENGVTVLLIHGLGCSGRWFEFEEHRPQVKFNWLVPGLTD